MDQAWDRTATLLWSLGLAVACGFVYLLFAGDFHFKFEQSPAPLHILTAEAFLHGQAHLTDQRVQVLRDRGIYRANEELADRERAVGQAPSPSQRDAFINDYINRVAFHDWTLVNGKYYGYWAPLAAMVSMPFVLCFGVGVSDTLMTALFGMLNVGLFYWLLCRVDRAGLCPLTKPCRVTLTLVLALGSVHFYSACIGQVWFAAQVITLTAVLAALIAACSVTNRWWHVLLAGVFFGLALLGRNVVGMLVGFFVVLIWVRASGPPAARLKETLRRAVLFGLPCALAVVAQGAYNYARFHNVFDTGLATQIRTTGHPRFLDDFNKYGEFNVHFLPRNLWYYFVNPQFAKLEDGWHFDTDGNSLFIVTPLLLYMFLLWRRWTGFTVALLAGVVPFVGVLMIYFATGWVQWGNRYLMEALPLLLLLAATGMRGRLTPVSYALSVAALAINWWATCRFCEPFFDNVGNWNTWGVQVALVVVAVVAGVATVLIRRAPAAAGRMAA